MKATTVLLINGMSVYRISCGEKVNVESADGVVTGLQNGNAKLIGQGRVSFDKDKKHHFHEMVYLDGSAMTSPNRCKHVHTLTNVEKRHAFADCFNAAKIADIAPVALQKMASPAGRKVRAYGHEWPVLKKPNGTEYIEVEMFCHNIKEGESIEGHSKVKGECRVNGDKVQAIKRTDGGEVSRKMCCTRCTTVAGKKEIKEINDGLRAKHIVVATSRATVTVTFTGSVAEVEAAIQEYAKGRKAS